MKTFQPFLGIVIFGVACLVSSMTIDARAAEPKAIDLIEAELPQGTPIEKADCTVFKGAVQKSVEKNAQRAEEILKVALTAHPNCVCEVLKAVIAGITPAGGKPDAARVAGIVKIAVEMIPGATSAIGRCCEEAAPGVAESIRQAIAEAVEEGGGPRLDLDMLVSASGFVAGSPGAGSSGGLDGQGGGGDGGAGGAAADAMEQEDEEEGSAGFPPPVTPILPGGS